MPSTTPPQDAEFAISGKRQEGGYWLVVSGELDLATAPVLDVELLRVEETDANTITVDLSGVTFMDCAGAHLLCDADRRSRATARRRIIRPEAK